MQELELRRVTFLVSESVSVHLEVLLLPLRVPALINFLGAATEPLVSKALFVGRTSVIFAVMSWKNSLTTMNFSPYKGAMGAATPATVNFPLSSSTDAEGAAVG